MGRPKGGKNRTYSKEFKVSVVKEIIGGKSVREISRMHGINKSVVQRWVHEYDEGGEAGLTPKRKSGNPLAMYQKRKDLSEVEQLRYELVLAHMEIARLKKAQFEEWRDAQGRK